MSMYTETHPGCSSLIHLLLKRLDLQRPLALMQSVVKYMCGALTGVEFFLGFTSGRTESEEDAQIFGQLSIFVHRWQSLNLKAPAGFVDHRHA